MGGSVVTNYLPRQETWVKCLGQENALEVGNSIFLLAIFLSGKPYGERSLVGYGPWGHKESDMTELTEYAHLQSDDSS